MNSASNTYKRTASGADRERLILDNVDYVGKILSTITVATNDPDERENLKSAGMVGLIESANSFDISLGISFRTFAFPRIRGAIIDELRKLAPVSQKMLHQIGLIKKAWQLLQPPVTPEQLAKKTELSLDQIEASLEAMRFLEPEDWNDLSCIVHQSWKSDEFAPEHEIEKLEMKELLAESIGELPEKERLVVTMYYSDELNLAEIGAVLSLSESRVSRIMAAAKFRLKEQILARLK
ncbi:sigma-70 family RNA polymerase sigma factor [Mariniblastus fucicola]|uniref:RNA polymerase sigma-D factor n=1 Tax=Mariniblastus fucicola TaxID=980251 RepID=A0A5B9PDX0_9BACT|nr:sigma-70 family RNA polymerase sigma factor [Mariniblastus fucicola]QEG23395.1 RNA polymerase sigma-D factor [Mariniblastus fucicola]